MAQEHTAAALGATVRPAVWGRGTRIAFRFACVYIVVYTFPFPFKPPDVQP